MTPADALAAWMPVAAEAGQPVVFALCIDCDGFAGAAECFVWDGRDPPTGAAVDFGRRRGTATLLILVHGLDRRRADQPA